MTADRANPGFTIPPHRGVRALAAITSVSILASCAPQRMNVEISAEVQRGQFAEARRALLPIVSDTAPAAQESRDFLLDRQRLGIVTLADGQPELAEPVMFETFLQLRRQGINDDATVAAGIFGERGVIFWKGEPFEQALAYSSIAQTYAELDQWDNARAAALSSLFLLKNFGDDGHGQRKTTEDIAREAARREQGHPGAFDDYLQHGYRATQTDFTLGYALAGVANWALGQRDADRAREADEHFTSAAALVPDLRPIFADLTSGRANTVLVVDYGAGPEKTYRQGNEALAVFRPRTRSDAQALSVRVDGGAARSFPQVCDVNRMAADHMWNNFEDVRAFKRTLGDVLIGAGVVRASINRRVDAYDLAAIAIGLLARGSATVDLRYCDVVPQRSYLVAINVAGPGTRVDLALPGDEAASIVLKDLAPPPAGTRVQLRTVRLLSGGFASPLASADRVLYANDASNERPPGDDLPYILGGSCVRVPSQASLTYYQSKGRLTNFTLPALENLYREEGLRWDPNEPRTQNSVHVLDGGSSLIPPLPGTTGYTRLMCLPHAPYSPKSAAVKALVAELRGPASTPTPIVTQPSAPRGEKR